MAQESPAAFNQSGSYNAEQARRAWQFEIAAAGGVKNRSDMTLAAPVSGLSVNVGGSGVGLDEAMIAGTSTTTQGMYYAHQTSQTSVSISTANPSNPRIDTIYAQVEDSGYAGGSNLWVPSVVTGTATSGATLSNLAGIGAAPASSLLLGYVLVPAAATSIITADILNAQPYAYSYLNIFKPIPASGSGTVSAVSGGHYIVSSGNTPITLPTPFPGARVKVTNYGSGTPVVSQNASEKIFGLGLGSAGSANFSLGTYGATATCESDGVSWYITAGNADSGWLGFAYQNSWSSSGANAAYRKIASTVRFRGNITGGTSATEFAQLPAGFRPTASGAYACVYSVTETFATVTIDAGGNCTMYTGGTPVDVGGITYTVD